MSTLRTCPKCRRKSLEGDPVSSRVWCLYATSCGYSIPADSDVDAGQTHSDEPTTKEEREKRLAWLSRMDAKPIIVDRVFERRLIADVDRLEAEVERLRDYLIEIGADTGP